MTCSEEINYLTLKYFSNLITELWELEWKGLSIQGHVVQLQQEIQVHR